MFKSGFAAFALSTLLLSGCVVQSPDGRYVEPRQQAQPQVQDISGPWLMLRGDRLIYRIDVIPSRGGLIIDSRSRQDFATEIAPGVFKTDRNQTYQFFSSVEGRFEDERKGRFLTLTRP